MKTITIFSKLFNQRIGLGILITIFIQLAFLPNSYAQKNLQLKEGDRIRIRAQEKGIQKQAMTFVKFDGNHLIARSNSFGQDSTYRIPLFYIDYIAIPRSQGKKVLKGILIGSGIGTLLGGFSAAMEKTSCEAGNIFGSIFGYERQCEDMTGQYLLGGALGGALIGSLFGILNKSEKWNKISLTELMIRASPSGNTQFKMGIGVKF